MEKRQQLRTKGGESRIALTRLISTMTITIALGMFVTLPSRHKNTTVLTSGHFKLKWFDRHSSEQAIMRRQGFTNA
jgi:hypothetical protein